MRAPEFPFAFAASAAPVPDVGTFSFDDVVTRLRAAGCVFAEDEARLLLSDFPSPADLAEAVQHRMSGAPLEHILGWARFCGLRIAVDPGVFVPRLRTELLVREAVAALRLSPVPGASSQAYDAGLPAVVVDLCCGSGAVGVAIAAAMASVGGGTPVRLHAADIDPVATLCAAKNVAGVGGQVHRGDLFDALPDAIRGRIRVLAVNAPYVPTASLCTMPVEARDYEARIALDGGADGLDFHRRVAAEAPSWLESGGWLLIETSEVQAVRTAAMLAAAGFDVRTSRSEDLDGTVVVGRCGQAGAVLQLADSVVLRPDLAAGASGF